MKKVWVVKSASHDFKQAEELGELEFIFHDSTNLFNPEALREMAEGVLADAHADDYLLLSGPVLMNCIAFDVMLEKFEQVNLLLFHAKEGTYKSRIYG